MRIERRSSWLLPPGRALDEVRRRAEQLAAAGAVDAATRPLDDFIDRLLDGWLAGLPAVPEPGPPTPGGPAVREPEPAVTADHGTDQHLGLRILTVLAFVADGANFTVALAVVGNAAPTTTLIIVLGLAGIALALAHAFGGRLRDRIEGWGPAPLPLLVAMGTLILVLGTVAASIRLAVPSTPIGAGGFGGADPAAVERAATVNLLLTLLLLALYLASTLMAAYVAFATRPSPGARLHQVRWSDRGRRLLRARRRRRAEARRRREHRRIQDRRAAEAGYRAFAEQLRATADHIFAVHLGSPGDTDGLTARPVGAGQNGAMR